MRKLGILVLAIALVAGIFTGCKEKPVTTRGDLDDPVIILSTPEVVPQGSFVNYFSDDSFQVDIRFEDDIDLKNYEIQIRWAKDLNFLRTANDPWKETWFGSLDGTSDGVSFPVIVDWDPNAGPYEFWVKVEDESGKTSEVTTYLYIQNTSDTVRPYISVSSPNTASVDTFLIGQSITVSGVATDNMNIRDSYIRVRDAFTGALILDSEIKTDSIFINPWNYSESILIPAGTVPGDYNVEVYICDPVINYGSAITPIYIKPN